MALAQSRSLTLTGLEHPEIVEQQIRDVGASGPATLTP
jgi:hypothetical protein